MTIKYTIEMHNYWHCGSGLAAGADVDALVIKDRNGLPYIPGKTVKGLVREAADLLCQMQAKTPQGYNETFGYFDNKDEKMKAEAYFGNATLSDAEVKQITDNRLQRFMYTSIANTAINTDTETAEEHSLRRMEVALPCTLHGEILDVPEAMADVLLKALGLIKNLGVDRNRGLGRCTWKGEKA